MKRDHSKSIQIPGSRAKRGLAIPLCLALSGLVLMGCRKSEEQPRDYVAKVGGVLIQRDAIEARLLRSAGQPSGNLSDEEVKRAALEELIQFESLFQRAAEAGYADDPKLKARWRQMVVRQYRDDRLGGRPARVVTEADIEAAYHANEARYTDPEQRRGEVVFFKIAQTASESARAEAESKARAVLGAIGEESFSKLARLHSEDQSTRYRGGDMGWLELDGQFNRWEKEPLAGLFALKEQGDISPVIESPKGLYLVRLAELRPATVKPLSAVRAQIEFALRAQREDQAEADFERSARTGFTIDINEAELAAIDVPRAEVAAVKPPSMPAR